MPTTLDNMVPEGLVRISPLASAADSAAVARQLLIIDGDQQNEELVAKALFGTSIVEDKTGHVAKSAQFRLTLPRFPFVGGGMSRYMHNNARIMLPRYPLISIDTFNYTTTDGTVVTLDPTKYQVAKTTMPGYVAPSRYTYWPIADPMSVEAVNITFTAGYTTVPQKYIEVVKHIAAYFYMNRDAVEIPAFLYHLVMSLNECPDV